MHSLQEQVTHQAGQLSRQAGQINDLQQQLNSILPVIQGIHQALKLPSPPVLPLQRYVDRIEGLQKAAIQTGTESRLRQARDRYKQQGETLARELEKERSKGHNALPPDVAKQRRELFSNP